MKVFPSVGHDSVRGMFRSPDTPPARLALAKFPDPGLPPPSALTRAWITTQLRTFWHMDEGVSYRVMRIHDELVFDGLCDELSFNPTRYGKFDR